MKKRILVVTAIALALMISLGGIEDFPLSTVDAAQLDFAGCGITKKAFMKELSQAYEKKTGVKIVLGGGGATKGIRLPAKGAVALGGSCRHALDHPEEKTAKLHHVAWDALVVMVNKDNPVDNITMDQLKRLLKGEIKNWKELGGADSSIRLLIRKGKSSGVGLSLRELVFNNPDEEFSPEALIRKSSGPVEEGIEHDKLAMGVSGISSAKKRTNAKLLALDGKTPSKENIGSGKYPLVRPLYLVTKGEPAGEVKNFIDFALSKEGQAIISAQGTVNLEEGKALSSMNMRAGLK